MTETISPIYVDKQTKQRIIAKAKQRRWTKIELLRYLLDQDDAREMYDPPVYAASLPQPVKE